MVAHVEREREYRGTLDTIGKHLSLDHHLLLDPSATWQVVH